MIPLLFPLLALTAGILVSPALVQEAVWLCLPLSVALALSRKRCALLVVFLVGAGIGPSRRKVTPLPPGGEANRVVGTLSTRPDWRGLGVYLNLNVESIDDQPFQGKARLTEFLEDPDLLSLFDSLDLHTGDRLEIVVRLRRPTQYRTPGVFNFRDYLEREGIFWTGTIRSPRLVQVLSRGSVGFRATDRIGSFIEGRLGDYFTEDRSVRGLVLGMVLGRKQDLTGKVERDFQNGGLYHLVVVSGFNLAVVAAVTMLLARLLFRGLKTRCLLVVLATVGYAALVGNQPPVIRAGLMTVVLVGSRLLDRDYSLLNTICMTAFTVLLMNPSTLQDPSFRLTFAAVAAVAGMGVPATQWLLRNWQARLQDFQNVEADGFLPPEIADWRIRCRMFCERYRIPHLFVILPAKLYRLAVESLIVSLSVEIVLFIFMVESFHRVSPISPLLNVPAGVIAGIVTPLGLLLIFLPRVLALPVAWIILKLTRALLSLLEISLAIPHATLRAPSAPAELWALYGVFVGAVIFTLYRRRPGFCIATILGTAGIQGVVLFGDFSPPAPLDTTITFLDVGQGDSALIEFPSGRRILVDGGGVSAGRFLELRDQSTFSIGEDVVSAYLFSRRVRVLDAVVLTHAHNDHLDGLFDVLNNFEVRELWLGRNPMIPAYRALLELAQRRSIPLRFVAAGQQIREFKILHPPPTWKVRRTASNDDSVVMLLQAGSQTALFTGDYEQSLPGLDSVNVLKVPHHGSKGVRMRVRSDLRVISVGANNPFGHPDASALPALRTDVFGSIEVALRERHTEIRLP